MDQNEDYFGLSRHELPPSTSSAPIFVDTFLLGVVNEQRARVRCISSISNIRAFVRNVPPLDFRARDLLVHAISKRTGMETDGVFIVFQTLLELYDDYAIDFRGSFIVLRNFYAMLRLETNMWILSTIGGGYSALADCGVRSFVGWYLESNNRVVQAEKALSVSRYQIELARNMGDDVLVARSYIYVGYAFTQLDLYAEAFQIMLYVRSLARQLRSSLLNDLTVALFIKIAQFAIEKKSEFVLSPRFQRFYKKFYPNSQEFVYNENGRLS